MSNFLIIDDACNSLIRIGDEAIQNLIEEIRDQMSILFKICESIAMLDMVMPYHEVLNPC